MHGDEVPVQDLGAGRTNPLLVAALEDCTETVWAGCPRVHMSQVGRILGEHRGIDVDTVANHPIEEATDELAERVVLATAVCRALVEADGYEAPEPKAAYRLYMGWMRDRELWLDTNFPFAPTAETEDLRRRAFHAEIVISQLEMLFHSDTPRELRENRVRVRSSIDAWQRKTGYERDARRYSASRRLGEEPDEGCEDDGGVGP